MPELPEVEVLCRHLAPRLKGRSIRGVQVLRPRLIRSLSIRSFCDTLRGASFTSLDRRGKYLRFGLVRARRRFTLLGHLGMTGRLYVVRGATPTPPHTAIRFDLGKDLLLFEDARQFGRMSFDDSALEALGPEPLDPAFTVRQLGDRLGTSQQAIKVRLMDQAVVAGVGNIYASEVLFEAGIHPGRPARSLSADPLQRLHRALRGVLRRAVQRGSTLPLDFSGQDRRDGLFYFGASGTAPRKHREALRVYDREGRPCSRCGGPILAFRQAGRSTFHCPRCQR